MHISIKATSIELYSELYVLVYVCVGGDEEGGGGVEESAPEDRATPCFLKKITCGLVTKLTQDDVYTNSNNYRLFGVNTTEKK